MLRLLEGRVSATCTSEMNIFYNLEAEGTCPTQWPLTEMLIGHPGHTLRSAICQPDSLEQIAPPSVVFIIITPNPDESVEIEMP